MQNQAESAAETENAKNAKLMAGILEERKKEIQKRALLAKEEAAEHTALRILSLRNIEIDRPICRPAIMIDFFPAEVKLYILESLPDILSLQSLISSSSSFYSCYILHSRWIFCNVLVTEMNLPIFLQAVAVFSEPVRKMNFKDKWSGPLHNLHEFMCKHSKEVKATIFKPRDYDLKTLIRIAKLHSTIKAISQNYFESCLGLHPWTLQKYEKSPLEKVETLRIQRALYNVELYFRMLKRASRYLAHLRALGTLLHRDPEKISREAINKSFFEHFSYWEVEEMYSIIDYMEREYHYVFEDCKMLGGRNLQARSHGSLSILANLRPIYTQYTLGSVHINNNMYINHSNRYNDLGFALISMGLGFFWKVRKQDTPEGLISLLDRPIQRLARSEFAVYKAIKIWMYIVYESLIYKRGGDAPAARLSELSEIYIKYLQNQSSIEKLRDIAHELENPSSAWALRWIGSAFKRNVLPARDYCASWGYCMWTADRVMKIARIYWPTIETITKDGSKHGPRKLMAFKDGTKGRYGL